jgi:hypothetical protein
MSYPSLFNDDMNIPDVDILRSVPFVFNETPFETRNFNPYGSEAGLELPFEIYVGNEPPEGSTEPQVFIGARDGSLDMEVITDVKEFSPSSGEWWLQAKIEINAATGQTVSRTVEFTTTLGVNTLAITYLTLGKITVESDGTPQESSIQQFNYGPVLAIKCGGIAAKWSVILY